MKSKKEIYQGILKDAKKNRVSSVPVKHKKTKPKVATSDFSNEVSTSDLWISATLNNLPREMKLEIALAIPDINKFRMCLVSREWRDITYDTRRNNNYILQETFEENKKRLGLWGLVYHRGLLTPLRRLVCACQTGHFHCAHRLARRFMVRRTNHTNISAHEKADLVKTINILACYTRTRKIYLHGTWYSERDVVSLIIHTLGVNFLLRCIPRNTILTYRVLEMFMWAGTSLRSLEDNYTKTQYPRLLEIQDRVLATKAIVNACKMDDLLKVKQYVNAFGPGVLSPDTLDLQYVMWHVNNVYILKFLRRKGGKVTQDMLFGKDYNYVKYVMRYILREGIIAPSSYSMIEIHIAYFPRLYTYTYE